MAISVGQTVKVSAGQKDEDTGVSISGWSGIIVSVEDQLLEIEWDDRTLANMPDAYIRYSEKDGYDYLRYYIEQDAVKVIRSGKKSKQAPEALGNQLLAVLKTIKGNGAFAVSGVSGFVSPGLQIEGLGEIGLPFTPLQVKAIIKKARRAPFGKGSKTITDTSVRSSWEIDADRLSFRNPAWEPFLQKMVDEVKNGLGIEKKKVAPSLYKLLIYEKGDFFLPHKDSEKEKGMFATLVVALPSAHTGGKLLVRFDGREENIDFSAAADNYKIPFAAFYADCEHEIKPVRSGYRVCLVYNLLQTGEKERISSPRLSDQITEISNLLQSMAHGFGPAPKAVILGHQYTPANFSLAHLKGHDRPRAETLMAAAGKAGFYTRLGLVTHYQMGELEESFYDYDYRHRRRYYEEEKGEGTMGEVYEEYISAGHWTEEDIPGLGGLEIAEENIISDIKLGEGDPIEQDEEGYTGNAGMTIEYWYHYGALFIWPQSMHGSLLNSLSAQSKLQWIDYYGRHWEDENLSSQKRTVQLLSQLPHKSIDQERHWGEVADFSPAAAALVRLRDEAFLQRTGLALLKNVFPLINSDQWLALFQQYDPEFFHPVFQEAAAKNDVQIFRHFMDVLYMLENHGYAAFVRDQLSTIAPFIDGDRLYLMEKPHSFSNDFNHSARKETVIAIIRRLLALSHHFKSDPDWNFQVHESMCTYLPRKYVNEILAPILLAGDYADNRLAKALRESCITDLKKRTAEKPSPPANWTRKTHHSKRYQHIWNLLNPFLSSPAQTEFDYTANQKERSLMEEAIRSVTIDLRMETIEKGRPFTLRLIKTQAAYERTLKEWKEDMALLKELDT